MQLRVEHTQKATITSKGIGTMTFKNLINSPSGIRPTRLIKEEERDGERQQHMSAAVDAALTGRAYRLRRSSLQA